MLSPLFGDVYKSSAGAFGEAETVFVASARARWRCQAAFAILELGFGLGINFLATLAAWRGDPDRPRRLDFISIEAHPLPAATLADTLGQLDACAADVRRLAAHWPLPTSGLHRIAFEQGQVILTLAFGDAAAILPRLSLGADAFYLDGFAPARNPAMWSPALMKQLARRARPGASVASYSVAAPVRHALAQAGFDTRREPGFGSKRARLLGHYAPRWRTWPAVPMAPDCSGQRALVIGAGIAGAAVADGLARHGWQVDLAEAAPAAAQGGSAQPRLALHLHLAPDDNRLARLTRAAFGLSQPCALAEAAGPAGPGRLSLACDPRQALRYRRLLARLALPPQFVRWADPDEASESAGLKLAHGGLWMPRAGLIEPRARCARWLAHDAITTHFGCTVIALRRDGMRWRASSTSSRLAGEFDLVVLACPASAVALARADSVELLRTRGQSSRIASAALASLRCVVDGDAWACPLGQGEVLIGSTFDERADLTPDPADDADNLARVARLLDTSADALAVQWRGAATGWRYSVRDRLPLIGWAGDEATARVNAAALLRNAKLPLPQLPGLLFATGFGSRGALWAALAAELIPALAQGMPLPIEADLAAAIDPMRFMRRMLRQSARDRRA